MILVLPWGNHNGNERRCCRYLSLSVSVYLLREDVWKLLSSSNEKIFDLQPHTSFLLTGWTKEKRISSGKHRSSIKTTRIVLDDFLSISSSCLATIDVDNSKGISRSFLLQLIRSGCSLCKVWNKNSRLTDQVVQQRKDAPSQRHFSICSTSQANFYKFRR